VWQEGRQDTKSLLETLPISHKRGETIRGDVFSSFLALVLKKERYQRIGATGNSLEWTDIKQDPKSLKEVTLEEDGRRVASAPNAREPAARGFRLSGLLSPPTLRHLTG
jgi:hypothetical protein